MLQAQIDGVVAAAERVGAYPAPVYHGDGITEISVFKHGEWMGSFVHDQRPTALSADGRKRVRPRDAEAGMEWVLKGQFCPRKTATFSAGSRRQRVLASSPGMTLWPTLRLCSPRRENGSRVCRIAPFQTVGRGRRTLAHVGEGFTGISIFGFDSRVRAALRRLAIRPRAIFSGNSSITFGS
jgi:hypothetical protein